MLKKLYAKVRFDRNIDKDRHFISPGGYDMDMGGKVAQFDFCDYYGAISKEDAAVLEIQHELLDAWIFPESASITKEDVRALREVNEFFVYTGEEEDPEIHPVKLLSLSFEFEDGEVIDCTEMEAVRNFRF